MKKNNIKKVIASVSDKDFGIEEKINEKEPIVRFGARGIVFNQKGQMAVFVKELKNEYKLPGGGIDDGENPTDAFLRECVEEIGAEVEISKFLGTIEEDKSQENFKQISFVFVGNVVKDLGKNNLTEKEKNEQAKVCWLDPATALDKMKKSLLNLKASAYDNVYRTKFMVLRDIKILEHYLKNN